MVAVVRMALALALCLAAVPARAESWRVDAWTSRAGLPSDSLNMVLPLADGHLLVTSFYEPPTLFDGHSFQPLSQSEKDQELLVGANVAAQTADGTLWFGAPTSGLVRVGVSGVPVQVALTQGGVEPTVRALLVTADQSLYIGTTAGLFLLPSPHEATSIRTVDGSQAMAVTAVFEDRSGRLWVGTERGLAVRESGRWRVMAEPRLETYIWSIHEDWRGGIWIGTRGSGLAHFDGANWRFLDRSAGFPNDVVRQVVEDGPDALWVATSGGGLARLRDGAVTAVLTMREGLTGDTFYWLHRDATGAIWAAGPGTGLNRVRPSAFARWEGGQLASAFVWSVHEAPDGTLWAGSNAGIARWRDGRGEIVGAPGPGYEAVCRSLLALADGSVLVGTESGLFRWREGAFSLYEATRGRQFWALARDLHGRLWAAGDGLWRFEKGAPVELPFPAGFTDRRIVGLVATAPDEIEFLTASEGVWAWSEKAAPRQVTPPIRGLRAQWVDPDGRRWLAGTRLGWIDAHGEFRALEGLERDYGRGFHALLPDGRGHLWVPGNIGLFRFEIDALRAHAGGQRAEPVPRRYTLADGLTSTEFNGGSQAPAIRTQAGQLWFASTNGLTRVDPEAIEERTVALSAEVRGIETEDGRVAPGPRIVLPAGTRRVDVHYTALPAAIGGEASFQYRLLPVVPDWVAAGTTRRALFPGLGPGSYRFELRATAPGASLGPAFAAQDLVIKPLPLERPAVRAGLVAIVLLLAAALPVTHIRALRRQRARLLAEVADKTLALEALARTDALTGLANRRVFDTTLEQAIKEGKRPALLLIDVDHFKRYNDALGHHAGDLCLVEVAALLRRCVRSEGDLAARLGGEEFALLLPGGDARAARAAADRVLAAFDARALAHPDSPVAASVTASIGYAVAASGDDVTTLYRRADAALYLAKADGRARAREAVVEPA
jgi:diguanylate cyclase (GGDEF)-like protein